MTNYGIRTSLTTIHDKLEADRMKGLIKELTFTKTKTEAEPNEQYLYILVMGENDVFGYAPSKPIDDDRWLGFLIARNDFSSLIITTSRLASANRRNQLRLSQSRITRDTSLSSDMSQFFDSVRRVLHFTINIHLFIERQDNIFGSQWVIHFTCVILYIYTRKYFSVSMTSSRMLAFPNY